MNTPDRVPCGGELVAGSGLGEATFGTTTSRHLSSVAEARSARAEDTKRV